MTDFQFQKACKIARHYGKANQKTQTLQELNELAYLLLRRRDQIPDKKEFTEKLISELADVEIMLAQMQVLFGIDGKEIEQEITRKLNRQLDRMEQEG